MKRIIANISDSYGLHDLHKKFSKEDQFNYVEKEVLEFNRNFLNFYAKPALPQMYFIEESQEKEYKTGKLKFLRQMENQECNEKAVFHYERFTEPNKILLILGKYVKYVLNKDTDKLWEDWGIPQIHNHNCGYSGIVIFKNKVKNDTLKFIDKRV